MILKRFRTFIAELSATTIVDADRIYVGDVSTDDDAYITYANMKVALGAEFVASAQIRDIVKLTAAAYAALGTPDSETMYVIVG